MDDDGSLPSIWCSTCHDGHGSCSSTFVDGFLRNFVSHAAHAVWILVNIPEPDLLMARLFFCLILSMAEILHQLIGSLFHYLQGFYTSQVVSRISVINSMFVSRSVRVWFYKPIAYPACPWTFLWVLDLLVCCFRWEPFFLTNWQAFLVMIFPTGISFWANGSDLNPTWWFSKGIQPQILLFQELI